MVRHTNSPLAVRCILLLVMPSLLQLPEVVAWNTNSHTRSHRSTTAFAKSSAVAAIDVPHRVRKVSRWDLSMSPRSDDELEEHHRSEVNYGAHRRSEADDSHLQLQKNITAVVDKKIRVAKAQAEIDRILKGPDAPFDMEAELKKVKSMAPPIPENMAEIELEEKASALEKDLYQAVKQQDYAKAAAVKGEISQMHIDDCGAVLQVNAAFYRAFSEKDFGAMEAVWLKDNTSTCIHPSLKPYVGCKAVLNSWKRMFESADGAFQQNWMEPHDIRISVKGASTAIVTCDEHVYARRFVRGQKRQTELVNKLTASNIFCKVHGKWFLAYHHASWHADSEASKNALRGSLNGKTAATTTRSLVLRNSMGNTKSPRSSSSPSPPPEDESNIAFDGILGMKNFGPLLGSSDENAGKKPPVKRIVMGSLSYIFNGNLGDILSGSGTPGDDNESGAIISFSRVDEDDDDDDDEDDEEDDEDDEEGSEAVQIIKQWAESTESTQEQEATSSSVSTGEPKDALRQSCITALRKLCDQGSISPKQKRLLLTDIITCSAKGEFSQRLQRRVVKQASCSGSTALCCWLPIRLLVSTKA
jgi:SnoaL-like domain